MVSYYTEPKTTAIKSQVSLKEFWQGRQRIKPQIRDSNDHNISGILVKKQGDFPPFWHKDNSFIEVMEELYHRVKTKNKDTL